MPRGVYPRKPREQREPKPQAATGHGVPKVVNHKPRKPPVSNFGRAVAKAIHEAPPVDAEVRDVPVSLRYFHWLDVTAAGAGMTRTALLEHILATYIAKTLGGK